MEKECKENHCHDCAGCGYIRPMTEGEAEIAKGLDKLFEDEDKNGAAPTHT